MHALVKKIKNYSTKKKKTAKTRASVTLIYTSNTTENFKWYVYFVMANVKSTLIRT